jgi:hypothetical protein
MESYDEFSRRARIMTEVHALPSELEGKVSADGVDGADADLSKQSTQKKKEKDAKKKSLKRL